MSSPLEDREVRDLFEHRYYRMNKMFLKCVGLWPHQSTRDRSIIFVIGFSLVISHVTAQVIAVVKYRDDWDVLVESIEALTFDAFCLTKFITFVINSQKMLNLQNRMRTNWYVRARDCGANIFHEYAENGRKMTIIYSVVIYITWVLFVTPPIIPKVLDTILRNGTENGEFVVPVDYLLIDMQKYYFYVVMHTAMSGFLAVSFTLAYDSMFMVYIQHGCGLYATLGRNLETLGTHEILSETSGNTHALDTPNVCHKHLSMCIKRHSEAIKYSALIEKSYSWCFFFIVGFNMLMISATGLQIVSRTNNPRQTIRFIVANIVCMMHLLIENYMAQILTDHSSKIRSYIHNSEWYKLPPKTQKILLFMIMRSTVPSQLTAGKMFVMSVQSFAMVLKTSLSYFTVLYSI